MPKLLGRTRPGGHVPTSFVVDGLTVNGVDPAHERRAAIRAVNAARQQQESQDAARAHLERCWSARPPTEEEED